MGVWVGRRADGNKVETENLGSLLNDRKLLMTEMEIWPLREHNEEANFDSPHNPD